MLLSMLWGCTNRIQNGRSSCDSHHVREDVLQATYKAAIKEITDDADDVIASVKETIESTCGGGESERLREIEEAIIKIQEAVLELHKAKQRMEVSAADYAAKVKEYGEQMKVLEAERNEAQQATNQYTALKAILENFESGLKNGSVMGADDNAIMRSVVEQIIIRESEIEIEFKCGVSIKKEYER